MELISKIKVHWVIPNTTSWIKLAIGFNEGDALHFLRSPKNKDMLWVALTTEGMEDKVFHHS